LQVGLGIQPCLASLTETCSGVHIVFRFSTRVMAVRIRGAIDSVGYRIATETNVKVDAWARELATLFDHATRSDTNAKETS
jgi:hypothetical protein